MSAQEQHIANLSDDAYVANERLARAAEDLRFVSRIPMFCECEDDRCEALILITLDHYREAREKRLFLTAPGHRIDGAEPVTRNSDVWIQQEASSRKA